MKTSMAIFIGVIIGLLSGVGIVQVTLAGDVRKHDVQIENLERTTVENRKVFEDRLSNVIRLWEAQLATERELISLVREQIRVMERTEKGTK